MILAVTVCDQARQNESAVNELLLRTRGDRLRINPDVDLSRGNFIS